MRRASTCLAVLGLALLSLAGVASAAPVVTAKAKIVPIPHFPNTGDKLGAGAAVLFEATISGTEYGGYPPPLVGINTFFPKGVTLHPQGFATCTVPTLEKQGPSGCSKKSAAGPEGEAKGFVSFGNERVFENVEVRSFFAPGGGLAFFAAGHTPASFEIISPSTVHDTSAAPYGPVFDTTVPLIETVPGAPDASTTNIKVQVGAAYKKGKKTVYYGTVPKKCPKGGFPGKAELLFGGLGGLAPQTVTVTLKVPCPKK
jgi:hypothetical protein